VSLDTASRNTGLLRAKCDPYGAESQVRLVGGVFPESQVGRIMWHCSNYSDGRFRAVCERGHKSGIVMELCYSHVRSIQDRQMDLCPRCAWPQEMINLGRWIEAAMTAQQAAAAARDYPAMARQAAYLEGYRARVNELIESGVIRKTPMKLGEVS
jgi:hypothetical protein